MTCAIPMATLRISKGDNLDDVSKKIGHFSTKFTLDVYKHWIQGKKKAEVDALDDPEYQVQNTGSGEVYDQEST